MEIKYYDDAGSLTPEQHKAIMDYKPIRPEGSSAFRASYTAPWHRRLWRWVTGLWRRGR